MLLALASQQSQLHAFVVVLVFGLVIAVVGHIFASRTLIVTGLIIIGGISTYFAWIVQPH